jgi:hypothetical protein
VRYTPPASRRCRWRVAAGLPNLPAELAGAKSYAERLFQYLAVDRLSPEAARDALVLPVEALGVRFTAAALAMLLERADGYPYFLQAYGKEAWDAAPRNPIGADDVEVGAAQAERELAHGFFGSRWARASEGERDYLRAMADLGAGPVSTAAIAARLGRRPGAVSPIRDRLLSKGLVYAPERGLLAFTVPHFGGFLRTS